MARISVTTDSVNQVTSAHQYTVLLQLAVLTVWKEKKMKQIHMTNVVICREAIRCHDRVIFLGDSFYLRNYISPVGLGMGGN